MAGAALAQLEVVLLHPIPSEPHADGPQRDQAEPQGEKAKRQADEQRHVRCDGRAVEQAQRPEEEGQGDGQAGVLWRRHAVGAGAVVLRDLRLLAVLGLHADRIARKRQAGEK